ncbi:MAG TPA: polymer-forming cytoskeletal protein [Candidatus Methylacidiphilales bacterium]|nr:polymer-forming cytoskeletal protein [Candidatus Methylacidiphilales bacterium]
MSKPKLIEVTCPHCHSVQTEPKGAISTNCRACGSYFKVGGERESRVARAPKANREVFCVKCGAPNLVASAALSTQCIRCLHYLELGDKVIRGVQTGKLYAYDEVLFAEGCSFKGIEATGRRIEIRGKVFSKLRATEEIIAVHGSEVSGELHALVIRLERGSKARLQSLECARLLVSGEAEISGVLTASEIVLSDGATFTGQLHVPNAKLEVGSGVNAQFDSITCGELTVGGSVTLSGSLFADRVAVHSGGILNSSHIYAAAIEVDSGGFLQSRVEKVVPREVPPETLSHAEAA